MRKLLIVALVVLVCAATTSAGVVGLEVGPIIEKGERPTMAYVATYSFSLSKVLGPVIDRSSSGVLRSDRDTDKGRESYILREFLIKEAHWKLAYVGVGIGTWLTINTDGPDVGQWAGRLELGIRAGPVNAQLGAEVVNQEGPSKYYVSGGLTIGL